jgi:glycosyltransferase involved in cell wall biosynthesis/SAM-dependent methyltransferase
MPCDILTEADMPARLFIHSLFRTGSTYVWNSFRRSPNRYWCYQEPLHEAVLALNDNPKGLLDFVSDEEKNPLRHPKLDKPYFFELFEVYESCKDLICSDSIYHNYFLQSTDDPLERYLNALCDAAKGSPVVQECRTANRIGTLKRGLGGFHIYLWRNPWDQWWSYKANNYFETINQVILNCGDHPEVIDRVRHEIGFVRFEAPTLSDEISHFNERPMSSENGYLVFYTLWCLALIEASTSADYLLNIDSLSDSQEYRNKAVASLKSAGFEEVNFQDCKASQAFFSEEDRDFFHRIEDRIHGLFLASHFPQSTIDLIKANRSTNQPTIWDGAAYLPIEQAIAQTSRLRQVAIRVETERSLRLRELDELMARDRDNYEHALSASRRDWSQKASEQEREFAQALAAAKDLSVERERQFVAAKDLSVERERQLNEEVRASQGRMHEVERISTQILEELRANGTARELEFEKKLSAERERKQALNTSLQSLQLELRSLLDSRSWRYSIVLRWLIARVLGETIKVPHIYYAPGNELTGDLSAKRSPVNTTPALRTAKMGPTDTFMSSATDDVRSIMQFDGEQFVEKAYLWALRRAADPDGLKHYCGQLENGVSKRKVLEQLISSKEAQDSGVDVSTMRRALKNHRFWRVLMSGDTRRTNSNVDNIGSVRTFEALMGCNGQRFVQEAYLMLLRRPADDDGLDFYLGQLLSGAPKIQILAEMASSKEATVTGAKVDGLGVALFRYRLTHLAVVGGFLRFLLRSEGNGISDRRLRVIEQRVVGLGNITNHIRGSTDNAIGELYGNSGSSKSLTFFTICSKNFTAYAKTLFDSVRKYHPGAELYLFLCDGVDSGYRPDLLPFPMISLTELGIPNMEEMSKRYNITEFNTAIKPFAFAHLFKKLSKTQVIYVDPDILLTSPLEEVVAEFKNGAECIVTPHVLEPSENVEVSDIKMLQFGIYNLGFIALRNTPNVVRVVEWWGRRLEHDCVIDLEKGLFVDQKWADLLPAYIANTVIIRHPGYNVAYWNLAQRKIKLTNGVWYANQQPLRFVHFSGNKLDDARTFSRHSWSITIETIGDLKFLLDQYRDAVYANGHAEYSKFAYSFSWNGASGINLHALKPAMQPGNSRGREAVQPSEAATSWMPKLLFIDCLTPRPDRDAGSITAFYLLKIYVDLGYEVTFIPSDLQHLGDYTVAVQRLGVRCLHREDIGSIKNHLETFGDDYDFIFVCRAPIAALYIDDIRRYAAKAKIILNTSDLHYLRDIREAEIAGDPAKMKAAQIGKVWELDVLRRCDVTIVMSTAEAEILKVELPDSDVRLIPLMYVEAEAEGPGFDDRSDILFIGGFPHAPNGDAVIYFCEKIFPLVRERLPGIKFHIVGNAPPPEVLALANQPGVVIHGFVKDISPLFRRCKLSIAPLRYGAGIKGKIGTSLSYGVPVVATSLAVEGMQIQQDEHVLVADTPEDFTKAIVSVYESKSRWEKLSRSGREQMIRQYSPAVGQQRIAQLMKDLNSNHKQIEFHALKSGADYANLIIAIERDIDARSRLERSLIRRDQPNFFLPGFCAVCGVTSSFNTSFMYACETSEDGQPIPNWREHLDCVTCGFSNRIRAAMHVFFERIKPKTTNSLYITEQTTPLFRWLKTKLENIVGSEYLGSAVPLGTQLNGLRNEDLTRLTFADESFDYILSFDVLEHVSDDIAALQQIYRCLKPEGTFLFSAPFSKEHAQKVVRAKMRSDGSIEHLMAPEYHGNPVDHEKGALCFRYFAWDIVEDMKRIGFKEPRVLHYWSRDFAYLGVEQFLFIATK